MPNISQLFDEDEDNLHGDEVIALFGWNSFGILTENKSCHDMKSIENVGDLMQEMVDEGKIEQWFFLYEGNFIAVRCERAEKETKSQIKKSIIRKAKKFDLNLQPNSFATYKEKRGKMFNEETVEAFANIMCWITELWMKKRKFQTNFSNYRFMERMFHCTFNVLCGGFIHGVKDEKYFLHQRILERSKSIFDDEFEDASVPNVKLKKYYG